jgi:hypothetical protein
MEQATSTAFIYPTEKAGLTVFVAALTDSHGSLRTEYVASSIRSSSRGSNAAGAGRVMCEKRLRLLKRPVGQRGSLDDTDMRSKGERRCCYRALNKEGRRIGFVWPPKRDRDAAEAFCDTGLFAELFLSGAMALYDQF